MTEIVSQPLILKKKSSSRKFASWFGEANTFRDKLLRGFYIFLLFVMDFAMFIYSINGRMFEHGQFNQAAGVIFACFLVFSLSIIFIFSFSKMAQNIVCGIFTMLFTVVFFYQFGQGNMDVLLDEWFVKHAKWLSFLCIFPTPWMIGLFLGAVIFSVFYFSDAILFVVLVLLFSIAIGVQKNEFLITPLSEYREVKPLDANLGEFRENDIVYMMVPKLPSYQFLSGIRDTNFRELRDLLIGFYATNNFEIYPNAFVQNADTMSNIVDIINQVDYTSSASSNRGFSMFVNNWNFIHGGLEVVGLDENRLYDYLHKNGYGVSMYAMPGFNFCLKNGNFYTDRCVLKGYKSVSVYDNNFSLEKNIYALLGEWFLSIQKPEFKKTAKALIDNSFLKNMRILSENRRVSIEGSTEILEKLGTDYRRDIDGHFYLVYVDLPSDIYIYDEFCNIKPRKEWVALKDNSLYFGGIDEKRKAYADQAKCLVGKLQEYMDDFKNNSKSLRTDIYIQGISPIRELAGMVSDNYSRFVAENLVNLAIRKGKNPKFLINANVCLASDFTKTLIRYQDYCYSLENMGNMSTADVVNLKKNLINNSIIRGGKISNIAANYRDWYETYKVNNHSYQDKLRLLKELEVAREQREAVQKREEENQKVQHEVITPAKKALYNQNIFVPSDDFVMEVDGDTIDDKGEVDIPLLQGIAPITKADEKQVPADENAEKTDNLNSQQKTQEETENSDDNNRSETSDNVAPVEEHSNTTEDVSLMQPNKDDVVEQKIEQQAEVVTSGEKETATDAQKGDDKVEEAKSDDDDLELF